MGSLGPLAGTFGAATNPYIQRKPADTALWQAVQANWLPFRAEARKGGEDRQIPGFVERAFERFLDCGNHSAGFARVRCTSCGDDLLVAFSCKARGLCPSCDGRRMAEQAAHLVDHVIPKVHVRQWVLTLPYWLRYRVASDSKLFTDVIRVWIATVQAWYRARAKEDCGIAGGQCAAVSAIQRFGDGLRLNPHVHTLFADGVWHLPAGADKPVFVRVRGPKQQDVQRVALSARRRIIRRLARVGILQADELDADFDQFAEREPTLALCMSASLLDRVAVGKRKKQLVMRLREEVVEVKPHGSKCAEVDGFNIHAATTVAGRNRDRLEQLSRYILRPAICNSRLERLADRRLLVRLKRRWADGTTAKVFEGPDFIAKLVALVPPPKTNILRFHGQFAPGARWRSQIVSGAGKSKPAKLANKVSPELLRRRMTWAELMKRTWAIDVLQCHCGGRREVIALIKAGPTAEKILDHLDLPTQRPAFKQPRGPPGDPESTDAQDEHFVRDEWWPDDIDEP
jgi:hypothetical protein